LHQLSGYSLSAAFQGWKVAAVIAEDVTRKNANFGAIDFFCCGSLEAVRPDDFVLKYLKVPVQAEFWTNKKQDLSVKKI
jgi:hypothetical protein